MFKRLLSRLAYVCPGGYSLRPGLHRWRGVRLGKRVWISQYVYLDELHPEAIVIGDNTSIGLRTSIFAHFYWGARREAAWIKEVRIGQNVFIGPHCLILPGVSIGDNAVIKGGSTLTRNVPANMFWGPPSSGPLARVTVPLTSEHSYDEFVAGLKPVVIKAPMAPVNPDPQV